MPLVRISLGAGRPASVVKAISDAVHRALVEAAGAPAEGKFQLVTEHAPGTLVHPPSYMGMPKSDGIVVIQATMNAGRTTEVKRALYAKIAELLEKEAGVRKEDVVISLVEVPKENWSWGGGEMTYVK
ncbi:MAG: tautomerase family protein [Planctomycetia bacterium]|nr:tautomerase family protein [Planctomycetia bacterium]